MSLGHVAATCSVVCTDNFKLAQHEVFGNFVPATCCTELYSLNFTGYNGGQKKLQVFDVCLFEWFWKIILKKKKKKLSNNEG